MKGFFSFIGLILLLAGFFCLAIGYSTSTPTTETELIEGQDWFDYDNDGVMDWGEYPSYPDNEDFEAPDKETPDWQWFPPPRADQPDAPSVPIQTIYVFGIPFNTLEIIGLICVCMGMMLIFIGGK